MSVPSDITRATEKLMIYFFYIAGGISLFVNSITLIIIVRKSSALTTEIKIIAIFQQISCLLSNALIALLFIPFMYFRIGGGYCVGALCLIVPYQYLSLTAMFLTMCMLSAFGMMIIARHQLLLMEDSMIKLRKTVRYGVYFVWNVVVHLATLETALALPSNRRKQNGIVDGDVQLRWRERRLNWFLFYGKDMLYFVEITYYGFFVQVAVLFLLVVIPFMHMLYIVLQARRRMMHLQSRQGERNIHIIHAQTIIIQFLILLLFVVVPLIVGVASTTRDNVYRDSQTIVVLFEMVFVCSTLLNSIVIVLRNRNYRSAVSHALGMTAPTPKRCISVTSNVAR